MLSSVCVGSNDLEAAGRFYDEVLATLGMSRQVSIEHELGYADRNGEICFWVVSPYNEKPATYGNGTQVIFSAETKEAVTAFHSCILKMGGSDEGAPGPRDYSEGYFGAYGRDLDGNKLHASVIEV